MFKQFSTLWRFLKYALIVQDLESNKTIIKDYYHHQINYKVDSRRKKKQLMTLHKRSVNEPLRRHQEQLHQHDLDLKTQEDRFHLLLLLW